MKSNVSAATMAWKTPAFTSIYIAGSSAQEIADLSSLAREKGGEALGRIADREFVTPGCAAVSKSLQQLQAASQKTLFFISKNNIFMGSKPYSPHPGSLADSVFIQSFKFPPQNQEPAPVPRQNPLEDPFPKGGREPARKECQVGNTGIHLSRSPLVGQEKVGNFDFSVSSAMWGAPLVVDRGPCLRGKPALQPKAATLEQN